jgi:septum formation protein
MSGEKAGRYAARMSKPLIVLASASPRRSELLRQVGVAHEVQPVSVDEAMLPGEAPGAYVSRVACIKAETLWDQRRDAECLPVLGSDTAVVLGRRVYGKPRDRDDAIRVLQDLSGRVHEVYTAVALRHPAGIDVRLSGSEVTFAELTRAEIEQYWQSGEPLDKAGAYAVQGLAAVFISRIAGSYSGIMGLPLYETAELLALAGVTPLRSGTDKNRK